MEGPAEVFGLLLRVACVFALLFAVLAVLKRLDGARGARRTSPMQVLGSTRIGKGAALTVVRIGEEEFVLGVTDHTVSLITGAPPAAAAVEQPAEQPAAAEAPAAEAPLAAVPKGDFAAALGARLGAKLAAGRTASLAPQTPPTPAEFLRSAYRVARRRPAETTEVSTDAVSAALASVRGDADGTDAPLAPVVELPLPRSAAHDDVAHEARPARPARLPVVTDGSATPTSRHALRRAVARTEALRHEEHLWTRSCRPTSRSSDLDDVLG